jgi:hypothetical protein
MVQEFVFVAKEIREGIIYSNSMIYDEVMTIKLLLED